MSKASAAVRTPNADPPISHIVTSHAPKKAIAKDLTGTYRMIHGSIDLVLPRSEWTFQDGTVNPHAPKTVRATVHAIRFEKGDPVEWKGDEVFLTHEEAERLLAADMIEPLDAKPSRVGKVCVAPKPGKVWSGLPQA